MSTSMSTFQQYDNFRKFLFSFLREMEAKYCYSENEGHVFKVENFSVINKIFVDDPWGITMLRLDDVTEWGTGQQFTLASLWLHSLDNYGPDVPLPGQYHTINYTQ